jgi:hypothetical protein
LCWNADYQLRASLIGTPQPLYPGEIPLAGAINIKTTAATRTWEYWSVRLKAAGFWPPRATKAKAARRAKSKPRTAAKKKRRR